MVSRSIEGMPISAWAVSSDMVLEPLMSMRSVMVGADLHFPGMTLYS